MYHDYYFRIIFFKQIMLYQQQNEQYVDQQEVEIDHNVLQGLKRALNESQ